MRRVVLVLAVAAAAFAGHYDLLICHCSPGDTSGVETNIGNFPWYDSVTLLDCSTTTPTVDDLEDYGCVFTWSGYAYADSTQIGDNLADYVDAGGGVVTCSFAHYDVDGYGLGGRFADDPNYCPLTRAGFIEGTNSLGDYDDTHDIMQGVSSISGISFWLSISTESGATWIADLADGTDFVAINADENAVGINLSPGDFHKWTGDGWVLFNNSIWFLMEVDGEDLDPPYVDGVDPADGETDVPVDSVIVFHCKDDGWGVDADTIDFTVEDATLSGDRAVSSGAAAVVHALPSGTLPGHLLINDDDMNDIVCTWYGDDPFHGGMTVTCTVAAGLADGRGNETADDFVWSFTTEYVPVVVGTTWGAIKAEF